MTSEVDGDLSATDARTDPVQHQSGKRYRHDRESRSTGGPAAKELRGLTAEPAWGKVQLLVGRCQGRRAD
jgi:hypothetical protein